MGIKWKGGDSPAALRRKYFAKKREMERQAAGAIGRAATVLESAIDSRLFPVKSVSQQDAPGNKPIKLAGKKPRRTKIVKKDNYARVTIVPHWTTARSRAVQNLFFRAGIGAESLIRKGLVVTRTTRRGKSQTRGLRKLQGPGNSEFVKFNSARGKSLLTWAKRRDKGEQWRRHVVRLEKPEVVQPLQLDPSVKQAQPLVSGIFRDAARKGFRAKG